MLGLGGADTPGHRAERALAACVAIGTDQRDARQHDALFRRNDVNDALTGIADVEQAMGDVGVPRIGRIKPRKTGKDFY